MKRKLSSLQKAKSQTLGFFTFIVYQNTHQTSSSKFRIPSKTDCRKTRLTRRNSTQQKVSTKTLWRRVSSKLILNRPKINNKNQNIDLEISFGLTRHSTKQYPRMLQKLFFDWSIDIFQSLIDYTKFSTEIQWRLVTAVRKISPKYTNGIMVRLHPHRVTNWHHVIGEKKENVPWKVNVKLWMQFMIVVSLHQSHESQNDIHMRRHFQVMCSI